MAEFALVKISDGSLIKRTDSDNESSTFPPDLSNKGLEWFPVVRNAQPAFDPFTQKLEQNNGVVATNYVFDWDIVALTAQEQTDFQQNDDISSINAGVVDAAEILITLIDALLANSTITTGDFDLATRQKYQAFKARVDRLKA